MSRRTRPENRCQKCYMRIDLCYCTFVEEIESATKILIVMHRFEEHKPTNTVRLMKLLMPATEIQMFGGIDDKLDLSALENPENTHLLLYPGLEAAVLDEEYARGLEKPVTLVIPDGTWQQAKRLANNRLLPLRSLPKVRLVAGAPSQYRVRKNQAEDGLCTLEAVARALGILEGPAIQNHLEKSLALMVERVLWSRRTGAAFPGNHVDAVAGAVVGSAVAGLPNES